MSQKKIQSKAGLEIQPKAVTDTDVGKLHALDAKIDETDEMKLKLLSQSQANQDKEDLLYPAELNAHFIEQIKVLSSENTELRKCIFGKDTEIKEQTKLITELNQRIRDIISGTGPAISNKAAGVISAKIAELCKTNRRLIAEVESYKSKNAVLERKIVQTELYYKESTQQLDACACKVDVINVVEATPDELNELKEKLSVASKKLSDTKNKNLELKNEILMANKVLQQELGDKFTCIKDLQCDHGGFKGRAQQITLLNVKISQLEEKLNIKSKERNIVDERRKEQQNQIIRELENKKKREIEETMREFEKMKTELCETKKKLDGARARIRILECDATTLRQRIQTLAEKSNHDDLLINEQRQQMKAIELHYQDILRDGTSTINKLREANDESHKEIKNFDNKIEALRSQVSEKTSKIDELKRQLQRYEEISLQSVFYTPMKTATDNEIKKLSDLIKTQNSRLVELRHQMEELENINRKLREKNIKMMRRNNLLESENGAFRESRTKISRTSLLREPSVLKKSASSLSIRQKSASLGFGSKSSVDPCHEESKSSVINTCDCNLEKEDLKNKLELTEEKLNIMEDKVKMLEEEKAEDLEHLTDMIQTSKQLFNDALMVLQKEKCICNALCCTSKPKE